MLDIKGNSGCIIDVIEQNDSLFVRKSSKDPKYLDRLYKQGIKQQNDSCTKNCAINVPTIHKLEKTNTETYILMDYIYAKQFVDYFESASKQDIDTFINTFIKYISNEMDECCIETIDKSIFINKFDSIVDALKQKEKYAFESWIGILDNCKKIIDELPQKIQLPVGKCHGDLTFSNMLFSSNCIYFIDYLDSFIETPIQDIVKLRQDTKYMWSTLMYSKQYDSIRLKMIFDYIDNRIDEYFNNTNIYYSKYYNVLQIINILRIAPYIKEEKVRNFIIDTLTNLLKKS